jgi:uncharacterized protein involved in exopolysaccharide biosynthesis
MENKQKNSYNFNSVDLLIYMWKKRWILMGVGFVAAVSSIVISLMITPMFEANVIMFPATSASISKELLVHNYSGRQNVHGFGEEDQAEQLLQVLNSEPIRTRIIEKYDLMEHYDIDPSGKYPITELLEQYRSNINFRLTEFMSVEVSVLDKDPVIAADIANDISDLVDTVYNDMKKERALQALELVDTQYREAEEDLLLHRDSLNMIYYDFTRELDQGGNTTEDLIRAITKNWARYTAMNDRVRNSASIEAALGLRYREARVEAEQNLAHKFVVERAIPPEKKAYPNKSLIVIVSTFASLLFALIVLIVIDNIKERLALQKEE